MISRYQKKEMQYIWSEENKFSSWLEMELLTCEAFNKLDHISDADMLKLRDNATFDIQRIYEIEQETRHDVVAFTRAVSETLGTEKRWIHYL